MPQVASTQKGVKVVAKWNKKICIQKISESPFLPSPLEESSRTNGQGTLSPAIQRVRDLVRRGIGQQVRK